MWYTNDFDDYELLDASDGERLERWKDILLIRPDPQIIWRDCKTHPAWRKADARYRRSPTGGGKWDFRTLNEKTWNEGWTISRKGLVFRVRPTGFKHTGVFPEQAVNWDLMRSLITSANREINVLNLFAYTGGATVACAKAGASVCHVDAAKAMVERAKENVELSKVENPKVRYIVDDCKKFVEREIRRGRKYDAVIMDPPSYGRGANGEVWKLIGRAHV